MSSGPTRRGVASSGMGSASKAFGMGIGASSCGVSETADRQTRHRDVSKTHYKSRGHSICTEHILRGSVDRSRLDLARLVAR